jgi:hypothetical protein
MPKLRYKDKLPSSNEFQKALLEALGNSNPVDDLLDLSNDLWEFENQHQLSSVEFYQKYQAGLLEDELQHNVEWAITYDLFVKTKRKLEAALMRAAVQPEILEPV